MLDTSARVARKVVAWTARPTSSVQPPRRAAQERRKIAAILGTPVYVGLLALVIEAAKRFLGL